ncbi:DUF3445 domain-containing protein [Pyrenophora tritici-repentis]|nr:DUF3445 domain-containing protein [Pyrenophora tritici-repentis]KAI0575630.1 DUF3445 domain-containing protein [Pyrenophora tritici-repentis]KAI0585317.1 DUF3445 domain-containing protein [Pyrenophora tritici-repentis]KAI0610997.1 DUF3445 domain-containing protein [Pyrenophora tritici-repentis]KAI0622978.1 DUF3445 domain-containing protein [Pyrenophora tritici-repentis]
MGFEWYTQIGVILLVAVLGVGVRRWQRSVKSASPPTTLHDQKPTSNPHSNKTETYTTITPLTPFHLPTTHPLQLRPFKPKYHLTMALENCPLSSLLELDNTYAARLVERRRIITTERHEVLGVTPEGEGAVLEFYAWMVRVYLPGRWPGVYAVEDAKGLRNTVTGDLLPLDVNGDVELALEILGGNIDTEFLFLLPSSTPSQPTYHLRSYINTSPAGFSTRSKLSLCLSAIHSPVPGYAAKLEKSMDRFFAKLPVGKVVKRANWSVSMKGEFFCLKGAHGGTYMYPLQQLRDEGSGEVLAEAIDGLRLGSVPDMTVYKKQDVWGEKVKAFLRGEIEIDG